MQPRREMHIALAGAAAAVALTVAACGSPPSTSPPPTAVVQRASTPTGEAVAQPATRAALQTVVAQRAPTLTPFPPSPTPLPPTRTPIPALPLRISAQLDPPTPHAGEEFVLSLSITNDGQRAARGVYVATSGPWERWTVEDIQPSGTFERDAAGWHIIAAEEIPPGESRTLEMHIRADAPAQEQLTFAVREAEPGELTH